MKLKLCGLNDFSQFGEESNCETIFKDPAINPAIDSTFKIDSILSYSSYSNHTVIITNDGQALGVGDNHDLKITGSLKKQILTKFTKFQIKDKFGKPWIPFSAVCGEKYTLYLVSNSKTGSKMQLAYTNSNLKSTFPLFLNTGKSNPVVLFGGQSISAAIDSEGAILLISEAVIDDPDTPIKSIQLPKNEKAINVVCCKDFIVALSENHQIFFLNSTKISASLQFMPLKELQKTKIINISGTTNHCLAVTEDGKAFGLGENYNGQLGIGKDVEKVDKFTEITYLNKYKITSAYAGCSHSLFQTREGKILACGGNKFGCIPGHKPCRQYIYLPSETDINKDATFCICGDQITAIFINFIPKRCPNQQLNEKVHLPSSPSPSSLLPEKKESDSLSKAEAEITKLKAEISRLKNQIKTLESEKSKKDSPQPSLSSSSPATPATPATPAKPSLIQIQIFDQKKVSELRVVESIGRGGQSEVFKVAQEQYLALKVLDTNKSSKSKSKKAKKGDSESDQFTQWKKFIMEYEIIRGLNHPNIITAHGFSFGDEEHSPSILLQYCPHNLVDQIEDMNEVQKICAIYEISSGMEAVHAANFIHRDLKPANILLDENNHVRISDFGISCIIDTEEQSQSMTAGIGTLKYMAPELLKGSTHYDNKVDVYSFGVVLFYILTEGEMPDINVIDQGNGKKAKIPKEVNSISKELILKCWEFEPKDRPSFTEIIDYIKRNNFKLIDGLERKVGQIKSFLSI